MIDFSGEMFSDKTGAVDFSMTISHEMLQKISGEIRHRFDEVDNEISARDIPPEYVEGKKANLRISNELIGREFFDVEGTTAETLLPEFKLEKKQAEIDALTEQYSLVPDGIPAVMYALLSDMSPMNELYRTYVSDLAFIARNNVDSNLWKEERYEGSTDYLRLTDYRKALREYRQVYGMLDARHLFHETRQNGPFSRKLFKDTLEQAEFADQFFEAVLESSNPKQEVEGLLTSLKRDRGEKTQDFLVNSLIFRHRVTERELSARLAEISQSQDMKEEEKDVRRKEIKDLVDFLYESRTSPIHRLLGSDNYERISKLFS